MLACQVLTPPQDMERLLGLTDDAVSATTFEWSADAPAGVTVEFDPGNDVADPTVTITKTAPTGDAIIVTLTLFVSDVANPTPVEASIEIDVYDDACHMARVAEGKSAATDYLKCTMPNDTNGDCVDYL